MGFSSIGHLLLILVIFLLLFGPNRLSTIMQELAKGYRAFIDGIREQDTRAQPSPPPTDPSDPH